MLSILRNAIIAVAIGLASCSPQAKAENVMILYDVDIEQCENQPEFFACNNHTVRSKKPLTADAVLYWDKRVRENFTYKSDMEVFGVEDRTRSFALQVLRNIS